MSQTLSWVATAVFVGVVWASRRPGRGRHGQRPGRLDGVGRTGRSALARRDAAEPSRGTGAIRLITQRLLDLRHARKQVNTAAAPREGRALYVRESDADALRFRLYRRSERVASSASQYSYSKMITLARRAVNPHSIM